MATSIDLPWSSTVLATDSSDVGYGVCAREADGHLVAQTARTCEKWRYAVEGAVKARANALGLEAGDRDRDALRDDCARLVQTDFKEVCPSLLDAAQWRVLFKGAWNFRENILRTEGRAMLSGVRHLLRTRRCAGQHYLLLVDNLSLALACCKGRGSSALANSTCRQLCALSIAGNCKFHVRWIPSERNCADQPSRNPWLNAQGGPVKAPNSHHGVDHTDSAADGSSSCSGPGSECKAPHDRLSGQAILPGATQSEESRHPGSVQYHGGLFPPVVPCTLPFVSGLGPSSDGLHQRALRAGGGRKRRGIRFRKLQVPVPRVRQAWFENTAEDDSSPRRISKSGSTQDEIANTSRGLRCHRRVLSGKGPGRDGVGSTTSMGSRVAAGRAHKPSSSADRGASTACRDAELGGDHRSFRWRIKRAQQDEHLRRECPAEPPSEPPASCTRRSSSPAEVRSPSVLVHMHPVGQRVQAGYGSIGFAAAGGHPVWQPARSRKQPSPRRGVVGRDKTKRAMADRLECQEIRESNGGPTTGAQGSRHSAALRRVCGAAAAQSQQPVGEMHGAPFTSGVESAWAAVPAPSEAMIAKRLVHSHLKSKFYKACKSAVLHRRQVFLEIFSGCAAVSRSLRKQGFGVVTLDIRAGPLEDVCLPAVRKVLQGWIAAGAVLGVWLGPPCTTWSVACAGILTGMHGPCQQG